MSEEYKESRYTLTCASCGKEALNVREVYSVIPQFGRVVIISMLCSNCGFRIFDEIPLEYRGPSKIEFKVKGVKDLMARVIRSPTSTLHIPELGLELKPGSRSEAFITNVEGVLDRFLAIAELLAHDENSKAKDKGVVALEKIKKAMEGKVPFTIIIEDEYGNSAVIPEEGTRGML